MDRIDTILPADNELERTARRLLELVKELTEGSDPDDALSNALQAICVPARLDGTPESHVVIAFARALGGILALHGTGDITAVMTAFSGGVAAYHRAAVALLEGRGGGHILGAKVGSAGDLH